LKAKRNPIKAKPPRGMWWSIDLLDSDHGNPGYAVMLHGPGTYVKDVSGLFSIKFKRVQSDDVVHEFQTIYTHRHQWTRDAGELTDNNINEAARAVLARWNEKQTIAQARIENQAILGSHRE